MLSSLRLHCTAEYLKKVKDYVTTGSKQYKFYLGTKRRQKNDAFGVFLIETSRQKMGFQVNSLKFRMPRIHDFQVICTLKVKCRTMQRVYDLLKNPEVQVNLGKTDDTVVRKDPDI